VTIVRTTLIRVWSAVLLLGVAGAARAQGMAHAGTILADSAGKGLKSPEGVACGGSGSIVVADTGNGRLLVVTTGGEAVASAEIVVPQLAHPTRVRVGKDGTIFVLDRKARRVARVVDRKFAGWVEVPGEPTGSVTVGAFALDSAGSIFLLDVAKNVIQVIDPAGTGARKITVPQEHDALFVDISTDEAGALYAVDAVGRKIWTAESGASTLKPFSKSLKDVMSFPAYVAPHKGRLYVVDQNGAGVVMLGPDGAFLGRRLSLGWNEGLVRYPAQICFDDAGQVLVADRQNNRVQAFSAQ
jgi:DNA-binding beta-propeller fold protein YncE